MDSLFSALGDADLAQEALDRSLMRQMSWLHTALLQCMNNLISIMSLCARIALVSLLLYDLVNMHNVSVHNVLLQLAGCSSWDDTVAVVARLMTLILGRPQRILACKLQLLIIISDHRTQRMQQLLATEFSSNDAEG